MNEVVLDPETPTEGAVRNAQGWKRDACPWQGLVLSLILALPLASHAENVWKSQGPGPAINTDGVEGITDAPITGAIEAVVAHPSNANILWIGAVNGGIFRTDDATASSPSWTPQTDGQTSLSIGALELDPTDGSHNTLVAGIGRTSSFNSDGGARNGILRTTNGGATWTRLSTGLEGKNSSGIAPRGATIVFAADKADSGETGIFRSTNSGASFTLISGDGGTGLPFGAALDLVSDPTSTTRLFTVIQDFSANTGIFRSDDTGATWTRVSDSTQDDLINDDAADVDLAVGKAGPGSPNVYAAICDDSSLAGLFRTGNGAVATPTWVELDLPETIENGVPKGVHPGTQCSPHMSLVADPVNSSVVFIGGDTQPDNGLPSVLPNSLGAEAFVGRLFRVDASQSAGNQATPITHCKTASAACGGVVRTVNNSAPHADSREMVFDANGDLVQTDDGGIYKHTDPNGSSGDWVSLIGTMTVTEQHDFAYDGTSNVNVSGNQDNGTTVQATLDGLTWGGVFGGDGGEVAIAENHAAGFTCTGTPPCSTRYWSSQNQIAGARVVYDSLNVMQFEDEPTVTAAGGDPDAAARFVTPLGVNKGDPSRVIVGAENGVYESMDDLDSVSRISTDLVNDSNTGNFFAYGTVANADVLYYGSGDRVFVRTAAPPAAPVNTDPDGGSGDFINGITLDPDNGAEAFAADENQVFHTTNAGAAWTDVTGNLLTSFSPGKLRSLAYLSSASDDAVAVGTDQGVYVAFQSTGFSTWQKLGTGLPNVPVYELDYSTADDLLAAGTLGRGGWTLTEPLNIEAESLFADGFETGDLTAWN